MGKLASTPDGFTDNPLDHAFMLITVIHVNTNWDNLSGHKQIPSYRN